MVTEIRPWGKSALTNNLGDWNTAVGIDALHDNKSGAHNTAVGYGALYSDSSGSYGTAIGVRSMYYALH